MVHNPVATPEDPRREVLLDPQTREVKLASARASLTRTEFALLEVLAMSSDEVVDRARLLEAAFPEPGRSVEALQTHMSRMRRKLGTEGRRIRTVWGRGYLLDLGAIRD